MFTPKDLEAVETVFFHHSCPDGIAAREIHRACFPEFTGSYLPYAFGEPLLGTEREPLLVRALFLDCHPNLDELVRILGSYDVRVADHHRTFQQFVEGHPELRERVLFGDDTLEPEAACGCSGARLSYLIGKSCSWNQRTDWVMLDFFSSLISLGDTWQTDHPEFADARRLSNFIGFFGNSYRGFHLPSDPIVQAFGEAQQARHRAVAAAAVLRTVGELKVAFIPTRDTSDVAEILQQEKGQDMVVGFEIKTSGGAEVIAYSIRTREGISARRLAESIGGGGHENAAGCSTDYLPGRDPIASILERLGN